MADWKSTLQAVAPTLATALGGPLAGVAIAVAARALGGRGDIGENAEELVKAAVLSGNPDTLVKLKEAENQFLIDLERLGVERERIASDDRASARQREVAVKDSMPGLIALAVLTGFFGILGALIFVDLPPKSEAPLNVMLGALGTLVVSIGAYYFGSSAGSAAKTKILDRIMEK